MSVRWVLLACLILVGVAGRARADGTPDPAVVFDHAAESMDRNPIGAKSEFARAAAMYEGALGGERSQYGRARVLYNVGAAWQMAGENGRAMAALRRADLLFPAAPGLAERLAAGRAEAGSGAATAAPAPGATTAMTAKEPHGATQGDGRASVLEFVLAWVLSAPRAWVWYGAIGAWGVMWGLVLMRMVMRNAPWRPSIGCIAIAAGLCAVCGGLAGAAWNRDRLAAREVVVQREVTARVVPDDLMGEGSGAALRPGAELRVVEEREGGDGQTWMRVVERGAQTDVEATASWVPGSAVARVGSSGRHW